MIYLILGNNTYLAEQEIAKLEKQLGLIRERLDVATLDLNRLADIVRGGSLFAEKRLVICSGLSEQKVVWDKLAEWAGNMTDDTTLVLVESKLDRRTKPYKTLIKQATVITADRWREKDQRLAEEWLRKLARDRNVGLSPAQVTDMVARARVPVDNENYLEIDQFILARALGALSALDIVTNEAIETVLPPTMHDTVFDLLAFATERRTDRLLILLSELRLNDEPHRVFALIATQWSQLAALSLGDGSSATLAGELGIHPFVAGKLRDLAREFTRQQLRDLTHLAADIDVGMKRSQFDPWDGIERLLIGIAMR